MLSPETISERKTFLKLLKQQKLQSADAVAVLRNVSKNITNRRFNQALSLTPEYANLVIMPHRGNTYEELVDVCDMAEDCNWTSVILSTSHWHVERSMLTAIKRVCSPHYTHTRHIQAYIYNGSQHWSPHRLSELSKIWEYQAKGHVATYKEGIKYLECNFTKP